MPGASSHIKPACPAQPQHNQNSQVSPPQPLKYLALPKCRYDHRLKQHPKWKVDQLADGTFRWTTPSGRQYTTEPTRYPT
jgi:hypothetical protein